MASGLQSLKVLRATLKVDFKQDKKFLKTTLKKLGFSEYFEDAKSGDYLSFYKLLLAFSENLDTETRRKITEKGTPDFLFEKILVAAEKIEEYKCCLESLVEESELQSKPGRVAGIYQTIQDICASPEPIFNLTVKRDKFNFTSDD